MVLWDCNVKLKLGIYVVFFFLTLKKNNIWSLCIENYHVYGVASLLLELYEALWSEKHFSIDLPIIFFFYLVEIVLVFPLPLETCH